MLTCPICSSEVALGKRRCARCHTGLIWRDGLPVSVWKSKTAAFIWKVIITLIVIAIVIMVAIMIWQ
ncbi:MAG: hypothetical protein ACYC6L_03930 [Anaerolineae bacterium]